jgi:hypothetical protein
LIVRLRGMLVTLARRFRVTLSGRLQERMARA